MQVDSFNKALQRTTTAGKLTALFKNKMLSRTSINCGSPMSSRSPSTGGMGSCLSADEMLQWSNVSNTGLHWCWAAVVRVMMNEYGTGIGQLV